MTEDKLIEIYGFDITTSNGTVYKKENFLGTTDYLSIGSRDYYIECYTDNYDDESNFIDDDFETYLSDDLTFESLKNLLIDLYGSGPLNEYRKKKLERIVNGRLEV